MFQIEAEEHQAGVPPLLFEGCMLTKTYLGGMLTYNLEKRMFYRFPAMRGIQANSEYFVCMILLGVLLKIFIEDTISNVFCKAEIMYYH